MSKPFIAGSGGGCFFGSTRVSIPDGYKAINEIEEGDVVLSFDDQGKIHEAKVLKVHRHEGEEIWDYQFWGGDSFIATPNHWVLNQFNAFVCVGTLEKDDCVVNQNNHLVPFLSKKKIGLETVYNLTVENQHTFIAENIRVHNSGLGSGIRGAGGGGRKSGGGSSHTPTEADDTLQSFQRVEVIDLISEGPIEGIVNTEKGIYLDGTPIKSSGGNSNFEGYSVETRTGTQGQGYISRSIGCQREINVGLPVTNATPLTRQISDTTTDRVRVTLSLPSLQKIEDDGDIVGNSVHLRIQLQYNGGGFNTVKNCHFNGKSSNAYQRDYVINLSGAFPVDVKVIRVTSDNQTSKNQTVTQWASYTEIIDDKFRYPNSALCYLRFDSRNFNGVPKRRYLVKGLKISLPSNASVDSNTGRVTYSGIWNGSFQAAKWCADPAWALWDLMTNTRYGASIPEASLDKWDFYSCSKYCNELVPNGSGGNEPRFSLNLYMNSRSEVFDAINDLSSAFRGISYYGAGSLILNQDRPSDSQYSLSPANVVNGVFSYSGSSQKSRHTTATVAWQDYNLLGEIQHEYVEDVDGISRYGVINKTTKAIGCYSQGQAHRFGEWLLLSEQNLTETVTFGVSIESGLVLSAGMVIDIADPVKSGKRRGGRISSVSSTTVFTVDNDTDFSSVDKANNPVCSVLLPSGLIEKKDVASISGTQITLTSALSESPQVQGVWMIETDDIKYQKFRVLNVAESGDGVYAVTAITYNDSIYNAVDRDQELSIPDISNLSAVPSAVTNVTGVEHLYQDGQNIKTAFELDWSSSDATSLYKVNYQLNNNNWIQETTTSSSLRIENLKVGTLKTEIQSTNHLGFSSPFASNTFNLLGKTAPPSDISNLTFEDISSNSARLRWDAATDLDVKVGGKVHVRHSSLTDGSGNWNNSVDLIDSIAGTSTEVIIPKLAGETLVKFADSTGNFSTNAASFVLQSPSQKAGTLLVKNQREDQISPTPFTGSKTNTEYDSDLDALQLTSSGGNVNSSGSYQFVSTLDLEGIFALDLQRYFVTRGVRPSDLIDIWPDVDARSDWDGAVIDDVNASMSVRSTDDDPSGSPSWGSWVALKNGTFSGRAFQFKTDMTSADTTENILVDQLGYEARLDVRNEQSTGLTASGTGAKTVSFAKPFWTGTTALGGSTTAYLPSVSVNVFGLASGDYIDMGTVTGSQFTITIKNSSGSAIDKNFSWTAVGYGRGA